MNIHKMKLAINPFNKITSGTKIIESRLFDEKRQKINIEDQIEFSSNEKPEEKILTEVKALYRYPSFLKMFKDFTPTFFGGNSVKELTKEIETFYSKEDQKINGVIGIKIKLLK